MSETFPLFILWQFNNEWESTFAVGPESKTLGESRVGSSPSSHGSSYDDPITPVDDDIFTDSPFDEDEALDGGNGRRKKPYKYLFYLEGNI